MPNFKVAFAGGGPFAEPIFKALFEDFDDLILISKEDKPRGRGGKKEASDIKKIAKSKNIPIYEPKDKLELESVVKEVQPDLVIVASLGIIITKQTLEIPKYGFVNVHFSLLPLHRGSSPVQYTILEGDKKAGISIQKVAFEVDSGDILYQESVDLRGKETTESLGKALTSLATSRITGVINEYVEGKISPKKQDNSKASYTKIIGKLDGKIDWNEPSEFIDRKVRAFTPWPSAYTYWNGKMLKILETQPAKGQSLGKKPGMFVKIPTSAGMTKLYGVQTGEGILDIRKLQLEGKRALTSAEFVRGHQDILGKVLGN